MAAATLVQTGFIGKDHYRRSTTHCCLALTLLGTVAASAQPYGRGGYDRGYSHSYRHGGNGGALIGLGIGLFALGAIAASQHNYDRDRYDDRAYQNNYRGYQGSYQDRGGYQNDGRNDYRGGYQNYQGNEYGYR
jgi:hypothetical protein